MSRVTTMLEHGWKPIRGEDDEPLYLEFADGMEKAESDNRSYQLIKLDNGLQALLVHDPTAEQAAAALNVGVGYLSDPDDMPGLSHLCEHLLFMGSKKYPDKHDFLKYIKDHCGSTNAYTVASNSCYFFSLGREHLEGAIDRFSAFFRAPLFKTQRVTSELNAVNAEYQKNRESDLYRIFQLFKNEALPEHSWRKFGIGNRESLTPVKEDGEKVKRERRDRLKNWWEQHYSASIMGLVILGHESLTKLASMAFEHFSGVPNRKTSLHVETIPWGLKPQGDITFIKTIKYISTIEVSFCLPDQDKFYESKPATYISRFIAHQGPGSLHSYLKQKDWITRLSSDPQQPARGFSFFSIKAELTNTGLIRYESVLEAIYAYLYLLPWALVPSSGHFEEFKTLQNDRFHYSEKPDVKCLVNYLSELLLRPWPRERLLKGSTGVWKQDESMVRTMLGVYLAPEAGSVMISSKHLSSIGKDGPWLKERWYGTEYVRDKLRPELFQNAKAPNIIQRMSLPGPNRFIPADFTVKRRKPPLGISMPAQLAPTVLRETTKSKLWFKQDDQFFLPKGYIGIYIRSPVARRSTMYDDTAKNTVMTKLVESLVRDALVTEFYDALVAGIRISLIYDDDGNLILQTGGYTDKMLSLLKHLLEKIKSYTIHESCFLAHKEKLRQTFENERLGDPSAIARRLMDCGLRNIAWTAKEMEDILEDPSIITLENVQEHLANLLAPAKTTLLVTGNFDEKDAMSAQDLVDNILGSSSDPDTENSTNLLPVDKNWVYFHQLVNREETNNAVEYYLQIADNSVTEQEKLQATLLLFATLVNDRFVARLRTNEQLGYNVSCAPWVQVSVVGMVFRVLSEKSALLVEDRIQAFLKDFGVALKQKHMDIKHQREALVRKLEEKPENQEQESARFALSILSGTDFHLRKRNAVLISSLKRADVIAFYEKYIDPSSPSRAKLSIHTLSKQGQLYVSKGEKGGSEDEGYDLVEDLKHFRKKAALADSS